MNKNQDLFRSYFTRIKLSLFEVSFKVLDNKGQSLQTTILLSIIQFFQMIYFPFQIQLSFAWENEIISLQIQKGLQYFTLIRLLIYQDIHVYLIGMYSAVGAVYFMAIVLFFSSILKFLQKWKIIILILSLVLRFCMTVGFIEITRILLGFLICKSDDKGNYHMLYCPHQVCWEGIYILHACVAITTIIIFFFITYIAIQLLVELRRNQSNYFSQKEESSYSLIFVYAILSLLLYSLLEHPKYSVISIFVQNLTSLLAFLKINYNRPFYNNVVQRIWQAISGLVFYTNFMLFISYCFENVVFKDTIICWMVSSPILLVILLRYENVELDLIKANMMQQLSSDEIIEKCQFLIDLVLHHEKDQKKDIYLTGYLEVHKQICENPNCAIKVNKALSRKFKENPKYSEKTSILKELISQIFQNGIKKYPLSVKLKLHYSYYLFDFLEQGQKALTELEKAENLHPSFGEEFLIFRMKKTIENYFLKSTLDSQNINLILNFDRSMKYQFDQLKQSFEELAFNKLFFWNLLLEEVPNITQMFRYGNLILHQSKLIQTQLKQRLINNHFDKETETLIKKFSKYVLCIDADEILCQRKKIYAQQGQVDHEFLKNQENLSCYSHPVLVIEIFAKNEQQAIIRNMNVAFHQLTGYSKTDLYGKPASNIIQSNFNLLHGAIIESYFSIQLEEKILEMPEKQTFLVHKSKYVIPTIVRSSIFPTDKGIFQFARFRQDYPYRQIGYIIFSQEGKIEGVTSSCISLLNIDTNQFSFRQLFIQRLFPYLLMNKEKYLNRLCPIEYEYLSVSSLNRSSEYEDKRTDEYLKYNLVGQLFEITSKSYSIIIDEAKQQFFGYYLKLENNEQNTMRQVQIKKQQINVKQFKYNSDQNAFIFEQTSQLTSQNESFRCESDCQEEPKTYAQREQSFPSKKTFYKPKFQQQQQLGSDIRTYRLFLGEIKEVTQSEDDEEISSVDENRQKEEIQKEEKIYIPIHFASQRDLRQLLMKVQPSQIFKRSTLIINILVINLLLIAGLWFFYSNQSLNQFKFSISLLAFNNQRLASLLKIQSNVQDLRGCNLKIEPYTMGTTGGRFPTLNYIEFSQELDILIETNLKLIEAQKQIKNQYELLAYDLEVQMVSMFTRDGNYKNFTYTEAIQQLIAKAITLNNTNITRFIDENEDVHYYLHNTLNSIPAQQFMSQYFYYYYIRNLLDDLNFLQDIFFIFSSLNILLIVCFIYIYYYSHKKNIQQIISPVLGISAQQIRMLINKIQAFIQLLQNNQDEIVIDYAIQDDSDQEEDIINEKDFNDKINRFRKQKLAYELQDSFRLQFKFWVYILLIYSYFCYICISFNNIISTSYAIVPLVNLTSYIPTQYRLMDNSIKEMLYDENAILYNGLNSVDKLLKILEELKQLDATLHQYNQQNAAILSEQYINDFNSLYIQDPCEIIVTNDLTVNITSCENFNNKILQEGLAVAITNFFENAQYTLIQYSLYNKSINYTDLKYNLSSNPRNNYTFNLYNTKQGNANRKMQKVFIRISHMTLIQELEKNISDHFQDLSFQTTLLFLIFCIFYLIGYFLFIIPMQVRFYMDNEKAKEILTLIPIIYLNNDENLQTLLRELIEFK